MNSGRFFFDGSSCHGNMLFLGKRDHGFQGQRSVLRIEEPSKRGFFFGSSNDLFDDEYYDEQSPEKKRRLTSEQVLLLEKSFETENKLEPDRKTQLAKKLGLQPKQVSVWFQNRRARWKTKQLERDYDLLKSSYDSLLSDYDAIIKENEKLKTEVVSLTEKLQAKEVTGMVVVGQKSDPPQLSFANASTDVLAIQLSVKTEDPLSSGTGGSSSVVDEDGPQLVDSGDSYFPDDDVYNGYMSHVDRVQSEEDDGSDDNQSCYWAVAAAENQQQEQQETEPLSWWIWP